MKMLWIAKVTTGVAVDGETEFSMFVADQKSNMYEVKIDEDTCIDIIAESLDGNEHDAPGVPVEKANIDKHSRSKLAELLSPPSSPPQHSVEQVPPKNNGVSMASVGFDFDYSSDDDYSEEDEEDPGEEGMSDEDKYVGPL